MAKKKSKKEFLNFADIGAMALVKHGADVYDYGLAGQLRSLDRREPGLVHITYAMNAPKDGAKQQPYFGAILTKKGLKVLEDHL